MKVVDEAMCVLTEEHSAAEKKNYTGSFCGFVLLNTASYDLAALTRRLEQRWGITPIVPEDEITVEGGQEGDWLEELLAEESVDLLTAPDLQDGNLVFDIPGALVAIGFMPAPVPDGEAERFAANNYMWPEAVEVTKQHTAHLMVAVLPREMAAIDAGKTYVKIISLTNNEYPREQIEGRITGGSVNVDGASAVRRSCSLTMVTNENDELPMVTDAYWCYNNKFKLEIGLKNSVDKKYPDIVWFNMGIYIITAFTKSE